MPSSNNHFHFRRGATEGATALHLSDYGLPLGWHPFKTANTDRIVRQKSNELSQNERLLRVRNETTGLLQDRLSQDEVPRPVE